MERREARLNELRWLKRNDPLRLIELFGQIAGLGVEVCGELPAGYGFERMISEILESEGHGKASIAPSPNGAQLLQN